MYNPASKFIVHSVALAVLLSLVLLSTQLCAAVAAFSPYLIAIDQQRGQQYLLDRLVVSATDQQVPAYQYRLWRKTKGIDALEQLSYLGTASAPTNLAIAGIAWNTLTQRLVFTDRHSSSIFELDLETNQTHILASSEVGSGVPLGKLGGLVFDQANRRLIVIDQMSMANSKSRVLTQLAIDDGSREVLYAIDDEPALQGREYAIAFDPNTNSIFLSYSNTVALLKFGQNDPDILTQGTGRGAADVGAGPMIVRGANIAFDYGNHRVMVSDPLLRNLVGVHFATGARQLIQGNSADLAFCWPTAVGVADNTATIADPGLGAWLQLDLATRELTKISHWLTASESSCSANRTQSSLTLALDDLNVAGNTKMQAGLREVVGNTSSKVPRLSPAIWIRFEGLMSVIFTQATAYIFILLNIIPFILAVYGTFGLIYLFPQLLTLIPQTNNGITYDLFFNFMLLYLLIIGIPTAFIAMLPAALITLPFAPIALLIALLAP